MFKYVKSKNPKKRGDSVCNKLYAEVCVPISLLRQNVWS